MREILDKAFPEGYWEKFTKEFKHNFYGTHIARTVAYHESFGQELKNKSVLEIGGFPGLETAWLLQVSAKPLCVIDSPKYIADYYLDWLSSKDVIHVEHDIITGYPDLEGDFDIGFMSDVLMHINGFPEEFMQWMIENCRRVYITNYLESTTGTRQSLSKPTAHSLKMGFPVPSVEAMTGFIENIGAHVIEKRKVHNRLTLIIEKNA